MKQKFYLLFALATFFLIAIEYLISGDQGYFTRSVIISGTLVLGMISVISYYISSRNVDSENPNKFVRGVMGGTFLKFFLCIIAVAALLFFMKKQLHKPDLYLLMFVYLIYTVVETGILYTISKKK